MPKLMVEGMSVSSISRVTGLHKRTILALLVKVGKRCEKLMARKMKGVRCELLQLDEIWTYVMKKQKRVRWDDPKSWGDAYCFVAIDPVTKLVPAFRIGKRDGRTAFKLLSDLAERTTGDAQITTDGFSAYPDAIESTMMEGREIDYAMLVKMFGNPDPGRERYTPSGLIGLVKERVFGNPDMELASTSHIERQNLTMRMAMRRFTRLTNAFSKKIENLTAAAALHFAHYNFCRVHMSLDVTPAMEAGITDHIWGLEELL